MIINVCFGTKDLETAGKFYDALVGELGCARTNTTEKSIHWANPDVGVGFAVTLPYDGNAATVGNGVMATIGATDKDQVDRLHAAAMANGGSDEGGPGTRENGFYCAYWRDPDGNKMNAVALS